MINHRVNGRIIKIEIVAKDGYSRFTEKGDFNVGLKLIDDVDSITVVEYYKRPMSEHTQAIYHYTTFNKSDIKRIHYYTEEVE